MYNKGKLNSSLTIVGDGRRESMRVGAVPPRPIYRARKPYLRGN